MNISRNWIQHYLSQPLPDTQAIADALTFHAFEIEGIDTIDDDEIFDIKVTPNRGHDCLSHIGIAKELSAILKNPLRHERDPFATIPVLAPTTTRVSVTIHEPALCRRYIACLITDVEVGESPQWLKESLEHIGQRSINNVVDATNYVMFALGQPLHAFDAGRLVEGSDGYAIGVRLAKAGEVLLALDDKEYTLGASDLVIADNANGLPIGIAGVKGGMPASITTDTRTIILEAANFVGPHVRRSARRLGLRTDASTRFEQDVSPELAGYAMHQVAQFITDIAKGTLEGFVDVYSSAPALRSVEVTTGVVNRLLGTTLTGADIADAFARLGFAYKEELDTFSVVVPFERLDITIPEDLIEEVARIVGYDTIPVTPLPATTAEAHVNPSFYWSEQVRQQLQEEGYTEVLTSVFADEGERVIANKIDSVRPYLRTSLVPGLRAALEKNSSYKQLLGMGQIALFEIGTVWQGGMETLMVGTAREGAEVTEKPLDSYVHADTPKEYELLPLSQTSRVQPFSRYPYIVRDVALWVGSDTSSDAIEAVIRTNAGDLAQKVYLFDRFEKAGRMSLAYRIIFQSFERTLTEDEVTAIMDRVYVALTQQGGEIR